MALGFFKSSGVIFKAIGWSVNSIFFATLAKLMAMLVPAGLLMAISGLFTKVVERLITPSFIRCDSVNTDLLLLIHKAPPALGKQASLFN